MITLAKTAKRFSPAISLILAFCIMIAGCGIVQPSREDLAGDNFSLVEGPAEYTIHLEALRGNVGMIYDTTVATHNLTANWNGIAKIYAMASCFSQECETKTLEAGSYKAWRGKWSESTTVSPTVALSQWLTLIRLGIGTYNEYPCVPADESESLSSLTGKHYTVTLEDQKINWAAICDAHPDTLFGGENYLGDFTYGTITLYFSAANYSLNGVVISSSLVDSWAEATILPSKAETAPSISFDDLEITNGILSEEWNMADTSTEAE